MKIFSFQEELSEIDKKCILAPCICYSCHILMKLVLSRQIFDKFSTIKFSENPSSGSHVVPRGQTDRST